MGEVGKSLAIARQTGYRFPVFRGYPRVDNNRFIRSLETYGYGRSRSAAQTDSINILGTDVPCHGPPESVFR